MKKHLAYMIFNKSENSDYLNKKLYQRLGIKLQIIQIDENDLLKLEYNNNLVFSEAKDKK